MFGFSLSFLLGSILRFYTILIFIYVIMSWFPIKGFIEDVYRVLASICEPYLGLFRRFMPAMGGVDLSPMVAILVLWVVQTYVIRLIPF